MDSIESAMIAKKELDNYSLFDDGSKLNIFYSDRDELIFHN
jgi:hypothetical protein